jgi:hypothetical protein
MQIENKPTKQNNMQIVFPTVWNWEVGSYFGGEFCSINTRKQYVEHYCQGVEKGGGWAEILGVPWAQHQNNISGK